MSDLPDRLEAAAEWSMHQASPVPDWDGLLKEAAAALRVQGRVHEDDIHLITLYAAGLTGIRAEVTNLRQALWDIYGILGFDQDGDATPAAVGGDLGEIVRKAAAEFRADYEEALDEIPETTGQWAVVVTVPANVPDRDRLFEAISEAAMDWEPEDREGWDIDITGRPA